MRPKLFLLCAAIGFSTLATPIGAQTKPVFLRSTCIKVNPGAGPEYEKLQADTIMKLAQYRIKQGAVLRYALSRAVLPAGEQSECDYLSSFSYPGFPTELTPEGTAKNLKAAGVTMSYEAYVARNRALSKPVATRIFRLTANAGTVGEGSYIHVNRMKIKNAQAWRKLETEIWKPLQEARVADGQMNGWASYELMLPAGSAQVFDAATVDGFANWDAQGQQKPLMDYFKKVHPNMTQEQFSAASTAARDLLLREVFKVVLEAH